MSGQKEHFNFEAFMNKIDAALSFAQKTALLIDTNGSRSRIVISAKATLKKIRELRSMIDEPLVWFRMEGETFFLKKPDEEWKRLPKNFYTECPEKRKHVKE